MAKYKIKFCKVIFWALPSFKKRWIREHDASKHHVDENRQIQKIYREVWDDSTEGVSLLVIFHEHGLVHQKRHEKVAEAHEVNDWHAA